MSSSAAAKGGRGEGGRNQQRRGGGGTDKMETSRNTWHRSISFSSHGRRRAAEAATAFLTAPRVALNEVGGFAQFRHRRVARLPQMNFCSFSLFHGTADEWDGKRAGNISPPAEMMKEPLSPLTIPEMKHWNKSEERNRWVLQLWQSFAHFLPRGKTWGNV